MLTFNEIVKAYSGKKVLITGHTGFKGSWLSLILSEAGANVMGYALPPAGNTNHFQLIGLEGKVGHTLGDIRNGRLLNDVVSEFKPEFVFHLAAQALVRPSYVDPHDTYTSNILGSINLLEAIRHSDSVRSLIYVTSDKCYENVEWIWGYRESDRLGGKDPYSASKAAAEIVFSSYDHSFFREKPLLGVASVRAGNVIGGGDWAQDRIVPDCIRAIESNHSIFIRNPEATRPWQHVLEPLAGYLKLSMRLREEPKRWNGSWNFGPSTLEIRTVKEVAEFIVGYLGKGRVEIGSLAQPMHEASLLQLNCDKAHQLLNWHPRWGVNDTLRATAAWYKNFLGGGNSENFSVSQINNFFARNHD